jgi:hypothetical protein
VQQTLRRYNLTVCHHDCFEYLSPWDNWGWTVTETCLTHTYTNREMRGSCPWGTLDQWRMGAVRYSYSLLCLLDNSEMHSVFPRGVCSPSTLHLCILRSKPESRGRAELKNLLHLLPSFLCLNSPTPSLVPWSHFSSFCIQTLVSGSGETDSS